MVRMVVVLESLGSQIKTKWHHLEILSTSCRSLPAHGLLSRANPPPIPAFWKIANDSEVHQMGMLKGGPGSMFRFVCDCWFTTL